MKRLPLILNSAQLLGWSTVLALALGNVAHCPVYLLLLTAVVQAMNIYDLLLHLSAGRRGAVLPWSLQNGARLLFIALLLYARLQDIRLEIAGNVDAASLLLVVWSLAEISRFAFYIFRLPVLRMLRYNSFLLAYPLGVAIELGWICRLFIGTTFIIGKILLVILVLAYLFGFPYLFLHLYRKRKQHGHE